MRKSYSNKPMAHKRKRGVHATWFAEIPVELKAEFVRLYPGRRSIRLLTVAFVTWAVRHKPDLETLAEKYVNHSKVTSPEAEGHLSDTEG